MVCVVRLLLGCFLVLAASVRLLLCGFIVLVACAAGAIVHTNGDGSGNTTPPPDDPGFANVGFTPNGLSRVYLGNRWVLTASHVGEQPFEFLGVVHPVVEGAREVLSKDGQWADLAMVKLEGPPPALLDVALSTAAPSVGDVVTLVGNGWSRETHPTCWTGSWSEVACPGGVRRGYQRSGPSVMRWGVNALTRAGIDVLIGGHWTRAFAVGFDETGGPDEGQIVTGDSGGVAFLKRGGQWELVGIHFAIAPYAGQPSNTLAFGNRGYSVDVFHYRQEIEALLGPAVEVPLAAPPAFLIGFGVLLAVARRALAPAAV